MLILHNYIVTKVFIEFLFLILNKNGRHRQKINIDFGKNLYRAGHFLMDETRSAIFRISFHYFHL